MPLEAVFHQTQYDSIFFLCFFQLTFFSSHIYHFLGNEVIKARYDAILDQSDCAHLYN